MRILLLLLMLATRVEARTVLACGHPVYPPISWAQDRQLTGIAPHLAEKLFRELGHTLALSVFGNWERCLQEARTGRVEVIVAAYQTAQRQQDFRFTDYPIIADPIILLTHADNPEPVTRLEQLKGKTIGLLFGDSFGDEFDDFVRQEAFVERVSEGRQNMMKLAMGRIDYMPIGKLTASLQLQHFAYRSRLKPLPNIITIEQYYLAIRRDSPLVKHLPYLSARINELTVEKYIQYITEHYSQDYLSRRPAGEAPAR
ncbi:substrate-binding periplasmic protein [Zobellella maritima]|uniref:substrate-binding periplasmic protein n=1 Tax=Zobellella maritima TaxID=2059725 RepID=UPI001E315580|nr:transporter substrate-binding domain-containing protein [Zobellella maritima]